MLVNARFYSPRSQSAIELMKIGTHCLNSSASIERKKNLISRLSEQWRLKLIIQLATF